MAIVIDPPRKLRALLGSGIRGGYLTNAVVDPVPEPWLSEMSEEGEDMVARVYALNGPQYWLSDRRIITESDGELIRYANIGVCHWMFRDLHGRIIQAAKCGDTGPISRLKEQHHDRIEIETLSGEFIVLEGLGGAFQALFSFFNFVIWQRRKLSG